MKNAFVNYKIILSRNFFFSLLLILVGISYFIVLGLGINFFSYDEIFTQAIISNSYSDIWNITATDVHPPLYYMMLKAFCSIFGVEPIISRFFSALGIISLLITGLLFVRKYFGEKVSLLFIIITIILPVTQYLVTEVRMYSWAMFFIFAMALSAYRVLTKGCFINYLSLSFFSVFAAYTHYFALLGVIVIFGCLLVLTLYYKKKLRYLLLVLAFFVLIYSIWLPDFFAQISRVNDGYWINKPGAKDLLLYAYYSFSPKEPSHPYTIFDIKTMSVALSIILILLISIFIYVFKLQKQHLSKKIGIALGFLIVALLPIILAILYSYLIKPIIVPRYITCYLASIILAFAIVSEKAYKGKIGKILIIASLLFTITLSVVRFFSESKYNQSQEKKLTELNDYLMTDNLNERVFIAPLRSSIELSKLECIYPNDVYLFYSPKKTNYTTKPFKYKEINNLPENFNFYLVICHNNNLVESTNAIEFMEKIKDRYTKIDSLVQDDRKIYRMRAILLEIE